MNCVGAFGSLRPHQSVPFASATCTMNAAITRTARIGARGMNSTPLGHPELGNMAPASDPNGAPKSRPNRAVLRRWLACLVAAHLATVAAARAGELCQFRGT